MALQSKPTFLARLVLALALFGLAFSKDSKDSYGPCYSALTIDGSLPKHIKAKNLPYANPLAKKGGTFKTLGLGGFDSLDFFVLKGSKADSLELVYDSLMAQSLDEAFSIYPLVAKEICLAADKSGVRFKIDSRAKFSDGVSITAADVKFSFDMLMERGDPSNARYYQDVSEARIINNQTIEFRFKHPDNKELPLILAQLYIVPKHFYVGDSKDNSFGKQPLRKPLGSGPYTIERFEINKSITYKRNQNYWAKNLMVNKGVYNFDRVIVEYYKDESVALRAFLAGEYDYRLEPQAKAWAKDYDGRSFREGRFKKLELEHGLPVGMQGFYINTRREELKNKLVREALLQCFDFEWSNKYLFYSQYKRTKSYYENSEFAAKGRLMDKENKAQLDLLLNLGILEKTKEGIGIAAGYEDSIDSRMLSQAYEVPTTDKANGKRENLKRAKGLLEKAGYKVVDNQLVDSKGRPLRLNILLYSNLFERVVLPFKKNLALLGIDLVISVVDSSQYENRVKKFDYDLIVGVIPQSLSPGNEQDFFFSSSSANLEGSRNFPGITNKAIDLLISRLNKTIDHDSRVAILRAMDRILLWGFYVIPHYYSPSFRIALNSRIGRPDYFAPYSSPFSIYNYWWWE